MGSDRAAVGRHSGQELVWADAGVRGLRGARGLRARPRGPRCRTAHTHATGLEVLKGNTPSAERPERVQSEAKREGRCCYCCCCCCSLSLSLSSLLFYVALAALSSFCLLSSRSSVQHCPFLLSARPHVLAPCPPSALPPSALRPLPCDGGAYKAAAAPDGARLLRARPHATSSALRPTAHFNPGAIVDVLCPAQVRCEPGPVGRISLARLPRDAKEAWELSEVLSRGGRMHSSRL